MSFDTWQASIKLEFRKDKDKTLMVRNLHYGPLVVQKPFYPEVACHVYLLHPPGGVASCDHLCVEAKANEHSQVLITTPGATKFYKGDNSYSLFEQNFYVENDASLEYLPAQNIFYKGTHTKVKTTFYLKDNSRFAFRDVSKCGMKDEERPFENSSLFNTVTIVENGKEKLIETSFIDGQDDLEALSGNYGCVYTGTYITNKVCEETLDKIRAILDSYKDNDSFEHPKRKDPNFRFYVAAGVVDNYTVVRFLSSQNEAIEKAIVDIWKLTRFETVGLKACLPRIWST